MNPIIILLLLIVLPVIYFISVYNGLQRKRVLTQEGWSGIGTYLQQRLDLIPNLVETVKAYVGHENKTLIEVTKWRNQSAAAHSTGDQIAANGQLDKALVNLISVTESYPDLKANGQFQSLQDQLAQIEEKLNQSRRYYNGTVRDYNSSLVVFPSNLVAGWFNFTAAPFFAEDEVSRTAPRVNFN
jgi:LemA protein